MKQPVMQEWLASSALGGANQHYIEDLYESFLDDPTSVDESWQEIFRQFPPLAQAEIKHSAIRQMMQAQAKNSVRVTNSSEDVSLNAWQWLQNYLQKAHLYADINPLHLPPSIQALDFSAYGLSPSQKMPLKGQYFQAEELSIAELAQKLQQTYCGHLSAEFMHLDEVERQWLQAQMENWPKATFTLAEKQQFLQELVSADGLERYLGAKFPGAKRFSLEGSDAFILLVKELIRASGAKGVQEVVFGMAHRGRLNMLVNVLGKKATELCAEFAGQHTCLGSGDVKYHQGLSADMQTQDGRVHLTLAYNPSHLEIVSPVVQGMVRARQDRIADKEREKVLAVTVHGDSAIAGQGVVQETLNMSQVRGYQVGGSIRLVINNQIGFTTSNVQDTRSMQYATDVAKMINAPVLHVNGDDAEAVVYAARIAVAYRQRFHKDIFIDLVSYRRHGHNEADEPAMTQPLMYQKIKTHPIVAKIYADKLREQNLLTDSALSDLQNAYRTRLEQDKPVFDEWRESAEKGRYWSEKYLSQESEQKVKAISKAEFQELAEKISTVPPSHQLHSRVKKVYQDRQLMAQGEKPFDWGMGESMAYATILAQKNAIRLSGEDAGRATFSHRHSVLHHQENAEVYLPLQHLTADQGTFEVWDSVLSEEAVLAFEYGYASSAPKTLTLWEGQFGDFANGAQVVIDQFISSGEQKWQRMNGLTLLLPHGFEGQGPEHSSARIERYLQLCAEQNMQVCQPTTPAQIYHLLRRQILAHLRRPLVVFTPKSLLRHPLAVSSIEDCLQGQFQKVLAEIDKVPAEQVERVVFCTGKVYYDLLAERRARHLNHIAIIRLEQLYPYPQAEIAEILAQYPQAKTFIWCQEEPKNQGAWQYIRDELQHNLANAPLHFVGRKASAAPAVGFLNVHQAQQQALVLEALGIH